MAHHFGVYSWHVGGSLGEQVDFLNEVVDKLPLLVYIHKFTYLRPLMGMMANIDLLLVLSGSDAFRFGS